MPTGELFVSDDADIGELFVVKLVQCPACNVIWRRLVIRNKMCERVPCSRKCRCWRKSPNAVQVQECLHGTPQKKLKLYWQASHLPVRLS